MSNPGYDGLQALRRSDDRRTAPSTWCWRLGFLTLAVSALAVAAFELAFTRREVWFAGRAIFTILFVVFAYRDDLNHGMATAAVGVGARTARRWSARSLRIQSSRTATGSSAAEVNGKAVRFMIDTGATISAMGSRRGGAHRPSTLQLTASPCVIQTANGSVQARRATMERLEGRSDRTAPTCRCSVATIVRRSERAGRQLPEHVEQLARGARRDDPGKLMAWGDDTRTPHLAMTLHNHHYRRFRMIVSGGERPLARLVSIMAQLRDPDRGCDWDLAQDHAVWRATRSRRPMRSPTPSTMVTRRA